MSEVSCYWEKEPIDITISGRIRLLGYSVARGSTGQRYLTFRHGDSGGDIALKVKDGTVTWPDPNPYKSVPGGGILFPDGLFLDTTNDVSNKYFKAVTIIYQDG